MEKLMCGECESEDVTLKNVKGRSFSFKSFPSIPMMIDCNLNVCNACSNIIYYHSDFKAVDKALEESVKIKTNEIIEELLLATGLKQKKLAPTLGITPVYLSNLKTGIRVADFKMYSLLELHLEKLKNADPIANASAVAYRHMRYNFLIPQAVAVAQVETEVAESNDYAYALAA